MYSTSISRITGVQYNLKFLAGSSTVVVLVFETFIRAHIDTAEYTIIKMLLYS